MKLLSYLKRVLLKNGTLTKIILLGTFWAITLGVYNLLRNDLTNESIKFLFLDAKICEFALVLTEKQHLVEFLPIMKIWFQRTKNNAPLVSGNVSDEKNLHLGICKFIFLIDFPDIFSFLF